ncbi:MAG: site-specific integrase, partial [Bdellovibrionales bacterium]
QRDRTFLEVLNLYEKEKMPLFAKSTQDTFFGKLIYLSESPLTQVRIQDLRSEHIDMWLDWIKVHPRVDHKKRKTFVQELKLLGHVLHWYHHFHDSSFVVPITRRHKLKCFYKRIVPRRPDYYMKPRDVRKWIKWLKKRRTPVYWRLASFMVLTGVRVGEACGLKWDALDLKRGVVNIFRIVGWERCSKKPYLEDRVKTNQSFRTLVLPKTIVEMLREMKKENPRQQLVFADAKGNLLNYTAVRDAFTRGFKSVGLPWKGTHICRHTYATMALYATRDISSVQAHLGHTTSQMTEKYAKLAKMISSKTAEKTAKVFDLFL